MHGRWGGEDKDKHRRRSPSETGGLTLQLFKWPGWTCGLPSRAAGAQPGLPTCAQAPNQNQNRERSGVSQVYSQPLCGGGWRAGGVPQLRAPFVQRRRPPHPSPGSTLLRASLQAKQRSRPEPALRSGPRLGTQDSGIPCPVIWSRCPGPQFSPGQTTRPVCTLMGPRDGRGHLLVQVEQADTLQEQEDGGEARLSPCTLLPQPHKDRGCPDVPRPLLALSQGDITWCWGRLCPRPPASSRPRSPAPWLSRSSICPYSAPSPRALQGDSASSLQYFREVD